MQVECWLWRYRDPESGRICQTETVLTAAEAGVYPEAERVEGSMTLREIEDEEDTTPDVFRTGQAPLSE